MDKDFWDHDRVYDYVVTVKHKFDFLIYQEFRVGEKVKIHYTVLGELYVLAVQCFVTAGLKL